MTREDALDRTLATLRFFATSPQGVEPDATGHPGFYHHFLDLRSGRRVRDCELSTVDTSFLIAGMLTAVAFFMADTDDEREVRELADALYRRVGGIRDAYMRGKGIDYFENSRRATRVQQSYAIDNPRGFRDYDACCWGISASDGPGPGTIEIEGRRRVFFDYLARGAPDGPDDGTIAPWAVVASLPFAPEIVLPTLDHFIRQVDLQTTDRCGFKATFNPTHPDRTGNRSGWVSSWQFGLNQCPIVMMIENYRSGLPWRLMRSCPYAVRGLQRAGFSEAGSIRHRLETPCRPAASEGDGGPGTLRGDAPRPIRCAKASIAKGAQLCPLTHRQAHRFGESCPRAEHFSEPEREASHERDFRLPRSFDRS